jgi:hypothetical protein
MLPSAPLRIRKRSEYPTRHSLGSRSASAPHQFVATRAACYPFGVSGAAIATNRLVFFRWSWTSVGSPAFWAASA